MGIAWGVDAARPSEVLWVDQDSKSIPEPKARALGFDAFLNSEATERWKRFRIPAGTQTGMPFAT